MTELAIVMESDERELLNVKVEIRKFDSSTTLETDSAHFLSENINRVLRDAGQRSSFREDNKDIEQDKEIVFEQGMLF